MAVLVLQVCSWENSKCVTDAAWTDQSNEHSTVHILSPILGEANEWHDFLIHKILTEHKTILELHFSWRLVLPKPSWSVSLSVFINYNLKDTKLLTCCHN